jgi:hypothetical protein
MERHTGFPFRDVPALDATIQIVWPFRQLSIESAGARGKKAFGWQKQGRSSAGRLPQK